MKNSKHLVLVAICITFVTLSYGQHRRYAIKNGIGLQGGITKFDILTDNFKTESNTGFIGGMSATVDLPNKWYNVSYNILLSENNIDINASPLGSLENEFIEYKMFTANIAFLLHTKLIKNNVTLDIGPMLQYNSELELRDESKEGYIITNYSNLLTEDITDISKFNINGAVGLSAGFGSFSARVQYIYGFTNILGKLNDKDFDLDNADKFEGHQSMLTFTAMLTF